MVSSVLSKFCEFTYICEEHNKAKLLCYNFESHWMSGIYFDPWIMFENRQLIGLISQ